MLLASAPAAMAARHAPSKGGITATGPCSGASTWKLTASPDNGRVEVQFEIDSNVVGQAWKVRLSDNGTFFFKGSAVTQGPQRLVRGPEARDRPGRERPDPGTGEEPDYG